VRELADGKLLLDEPASGVLRLTISNPAKRNALDHPILDAITATLSQGAAAPDRPRCVIVTGAHEMFSAGYDIGEIPDDEFEQRAERLVAHPFTEAIDALEAYPLPTLAMLPGHTIGGGLELALACDIRLASENATFGLPETKWAIIPGQGGTQRLPRIVPPNLALEMILTGAPIDAHRAYEIGLVNRVVPLPALLPESLALAEAIARQPPRAVRHAREAIHRGLDLPLEHGLRLEQDLADPLRDSEENREARAAFAEKRPPRWASD